MQAEHIFPNDFYTESSKTNQEIEKKNVRARVLSCISHIMCAIHGRSVLLSIGKSIFRKLKKINYSVKNKIFIFSLNFADHFFIAVPVASFSSVRILNNSRWGANLANTLDENTNQKNNSQNLTIASTNKCELNTRYEEIKKLNNVNFELTSYCKFMNNYKSIIHKIYIHKNLF